ncbi:hypothetical protein ACVWY3_004659 [Bradyrhizobium sp. USDA 4486]
MTCQLARCSNLVSAYRSRRDRECCPWSAKTLSRSPGQPVVCQPIRPNYTKYLIFLLLARCPFLIGAKEACKRWNPT